MIMSEQSPSEWQRLSNDQRWDTIRKSVIRFFQTHGISDREQAEDATQELFLNLFNRGHLVDQALNEWESRQIHAFVLQQARWHLVNLVRRERTAKRGGESKHMAYDEEQPPLNQLDWNHPRRQCELRELQRIANNVVEKLADEYRERGHMRFFSVFKNCLTDPPQNGGYVSMARQLQMGEPAFRSAAFRARQRFRTLCEKEIGGRKASTSVPHKP